MIWPSDQGYKCWCATSITDGLSLSPTKMWYNAPKKVLMARRFNPSRVFLIGYSIISVFLPVRFHHTYQHKHPSRTASGRTSQLLSEHPPCSDQSSDRGHSQPRCVEVLDSQPCSRQSGLGYEQLAFPILWMRQMRKKFQ